jgi:hypothetical protein
MDIERVLEMEYYKVKLMTEGMETLIAQEQLRLMDATQYPNLKDKTKRKKHRYWKSRSQLDTGEGIRSEDLILST